MRFADFVKEFNERYQGRFEIRPAASRAGDPDPAQDFGVFLVGSERSEPEARIRPGKDGEIGRRDNEKVWVATRRDAEYPFGSKLTMTAADMQKNLAAAGLSVDISAAHGTTEFTVFTNAGEAASAFAVGDEEADTLDGETVMENVGAALAKEAEAKGEKTVPWKKVEPRIARMEQQPRMPPAAQRLAIGNQFGRRYQGKVPLNRVVDFMDKAELQRTEVKNDANPAAKAGKQSEFRIPAGNPPDPQRPRRVVTVYKEGDGPGQPLYVTFEGVKALVDAATEAHNEAHAERFKKEMFKFSEFGGSDAQEARYDTWAREQAPPQSGAEESKPETEPDATGEGLKPSSMLPNKGKGEQEGL